VYSIIQSVGIGVVAFVNFLHVIGWRTGCWKDVIGRNVGCFEWKWTSCSADEQCN